MNIEEAKKTVDKLSVCGSKIGDIPTVKTHIVKLLLEQLDQPKPVVPKFVADWIEKHKEERWWLGAALTGCHYLNCLRKR